MKTKILLACLMIFSISMQAQTLPLPGCTTDVFGTMFKTIDSTERGVADNYLTWDNGAEILVKFMPGGSKSIRDKVVLMAKEWEKYANITFKFVPDTTSFTNLRVLLGKDKGHNSMVGTQCSSIPQYDQTINFDTVKLADVPYYYQKMVNKGIKELTEWEQVEAEMKLDPGHWSDREIKRVITHEFGHALGLLHEQSYPGIIKWRKTDSVYNHYKKTQKWSKAQVDFNVFEVNKQFYTNGTAYDPKSIMHYDVEPWQTLDGYTLKKAYELSPGDKTMIAGLYPKYKKQSEFVVPKVTVSSFIKVDVVNNKTKGGLSIFPSFDIKTNEKLGHVYFIAQIITEDNKFFLTNREIYNFQGTVATYLQANLRPNAKISYNKKVRNLELFLPFDQIPDLQGKKVKIYFSVYQSDVANNEFFKQLYFSDTKPLSVIK